MSSVQRTGLGYEYIRDRTGGDDVTLYIHQLVALLEHDPEIVFSPDFDIHHKNRIPWDNRPANLEPLEAEEHRIAHLRGSL